MTFLHSENRQDDMLWYIVHYDVSTRQVDERQLSGVGRALPGFTTLTGVVITPNTRANEYPVIHAKCKCEKSKQKNVMMAAAGASSLFNVKTGKDSITRKDAPYFLNPRIQS